MSRLFTFSILAQGLSGDGPMSFALKELLLVVGALVAVTLIVLGWAIFFRRRRNHAARRMQRHHRRHALTKTAARGDGKFKKRFTKSKDRRRRSHRTRNPTLAETGGLPPVREATATPTTKTS